MPTTDQFFGQDRDDTLGATIQGRRNRFDDGCDDGDSHCVSSPFCMTHPVVQDVGAFRLRVGVPRRPNARRGPPPCYDCQRASTSAPSAGHLCRESRRGLPDVVAPFARRTVRLTEIVDAITFALGGEAGVRILVTLGLSVSPDTLLNRVRAAELPLRRTIACPGLSVGLPQALSLVVKERGHRLIAGYQASSCTDLPNFSCYSVYSVCSPHAVAGTTCFERNNSPTHWRAPNRGISSAGSLAG